MTNTPLTQAPSQDQARPQAKDEREIQKSAKLKEQERKYYTASQRQLIWLKFRRHRLAMFAMVGLGVLYFVAIFCEFVAPYSAQTDFPQNLFNPPTVIHFLAEENGGTQLVAPFIYGQTGKINEKFQRVYVEDKTKRYPVQLFIKGEKYRVLGVIETDIHLFGVDGAPIFLFGTDRLGRDVFSRVIYGSRISLSIGLVGVFLSFVLGLTIGGISGYFGGVADEIIQRAIDLLQSIPHLPLWMALAAAMPRQWGIVETYFAISIVLSIVGWTGLARTVRGKLLSLREEDFTVAARISGASEWRIISKHLLPLFFSFIIVSVTMAIPAMILGETGLSFIGLGLQPPAVSWGVLLQDAQNIANVALNPWLMLPALFVIISVLMFNFLGDGLRDAADPYSIL
jgi:peptide/nickel transport system permease protein